MSPRIHPEAVKYALEQELQERDEELHCDNHHRHTFNDKGRRYLGTVKRGERVVHYWWVNEDGEMLTIEVGSDGIVISGNLESPLNKIPQTEMTVEELENAGVFNVPSVIMRDIDYLSDMGASTILPLEYRACDVLLPLLGINIIPESDAEFIVFEEVDWGKVTFCRSNKRII